MVVTEATQVRGRRDKAPVTEALVPPVVQDASESSRENPRPDGVSPSKRHMS